MALPIKTGNLDSQGKVRAQEVEAVSGMTVGNGSAPVTSIPTNAVQFFTITTGETPNKEIKLMCRLENGMEIQILSITL